eukprot:589702-Rhodomonas_salina.1
MSWVCEDAYPILQLGGAPVESGPARSVLFGADEVYTGAVCLRARYGIPGTDLVLTHCMRLLHAYARCDVRN